MKINSKVSLASALLLILALFCGFHSLLSGQAGSEPNNTVYCLNFNYL